jgi:GTP cyclohydrolase I
MSFNSQCEHHMLPFYGHVHVVYELRLPVQRAALQGPDAGTGGLLGSGGTGTARQGLCEAAEEEAVAAVVERYTRRLQVQERITQQVADGVVAALGGPAVISGLLVVVCAAHMCMVARGVENHGGATTTVAGRGAGVDDAAWRARALRACRDAGISS